MDGKRAAPRKGRRVVFVGDGAFDVPSARQRRAGRRIPTPVCALARNDRETGRRGDVGIAPYEIAGVRAGRDGER